MSVFSSAEHALFVDGDFVEGSRSSQSCAVLLALTLGVCRFGGLLCTFPDCGRHGPHGQWMEEIGRRV